MTATLASPTRAAEAADRSRIGRRLGAVALVVGAAGNTAQAALGQLYGGRPAEIEDQIVLANAHPTWAVTMCVLGTVAVPFMAIGFLAAVQELAARARRTAQAAGTLLVLGMWGFLAVQTAELIQLTAMLDDDGRAAALYLQDLPESPVLAVLFGGPFMVGALLGVLVLSIALLVRGGMPRWIPAVWLLFIVLDFFVGAIGPVDPHWLYLAGAVGLAAHLTRGRAVEPVGA